MSTVARDRRRALPVTGDNPRRWEALALTLPTADTDELCGRLASITSGVECVPEGETTRVRVYLRSGEGEAARAFADDVLRASGLDPAACRPAIEVVEDGRWVERYQAQLVPFPLAGRFTVLPSGAGDAEPGREPLWLVPGRAFGTGEHPTTQLCLEWLDSELRPGARVMDFGCGSGVLAIAALRLGGSRAWAVDIDSQALTATLANGRLNGVEEQLWIGTPEELPAIQVDIVIANILAGTLRNLAELFGRCTKPGGHLVLSGVLESQTVDLCQRYSDRFGPFSVKHRDGWTLLSATRR